MISHDRQGPAPARATILPAALIADGLRLAVRVSALSGRGARVATGVRLALGQRVALLHPEAGRIEAKVSAIEAGAILLAFEPDERAVGFALTAIAVGSGSQSIQSARR